MSSVPDKRAQQRPKLYQNDIVQVPKVTSADSYAIVLRCWHEPEDIPIQAAQTDPFLRPLKQGEVGITYISHQEGREIIDESELVLIDRGFQPGDYCKRSIDDVRSGVVTATKVKARLAHVISGEEVPGWKTSEDLQEKQTGEVGDYVIYDDWIGQVFDEAIVEVANGGRLVRLPELGSRLATGDEGTDILPPPPALYNVTTALRSFFGAQVQETGIQRVINIRHTVYAITWLAVNQTLDVGVAADRIRPRRFWSGADINSLTLIRGKADSEMRVGDRVYLKHTTGLPMTEHGNEKDPAGIVHVQVFKVTETITTLDVLWQDGVRETLKSTEIIPYVSPDEYDCWPGDHVLWKAEGRSRFAVVQSVHAADRTANLLFQDTKSQELVSLLELDPVGATDPNPNQGLHDALGVRRGDFVFIHPEGKTNGMTPPKVPHIGELESWVREIPIVDGQYANWRKELMELGTQVAATRNNSEIFLVPIRRPTLGDESMYWIGEVNDLLVDGRVEVTLPDHTTRIYPLERLTRLYDGMDQLEDDQWLEGSSVDDEYDEYDPEGMDHVWMEDGIGQWDDNPEWVDDDDIADADHACTCNGHHHHDGDDDDLMLLESNDDIEVNPPPADQPAQDSSFSMTPIPPSSSGALTPIPPPVDLPTQPPAVSATSDISEDTEEWQRFSILASAPVDHAFYNTAPAQPSRQFLGRLSKEYKALQSSLPESILVRAYEDRTDLLRSLIIGPENTPYQDAPFVIDWMLDSNYPHSPPIAHFLSWTNGNGRVNPNLYEEGKVCLSILGTWVGDQSETWSATRCSLLQAFVSIQGLVLVKEPWFCEPAYDKLRGTEEGIVNSRLYSEKAYVLSRNFIRRALEIPLGGLEAEIEWLYYTKGTLRKVLDDSRALVHKSRSSATNATSHGCTPDSSESAKAPSPSADEQDLAVPRLTAGGIITLERTLVKLQELHDNRQAASQSPPLNI